MNVWVEISFYHEAERAARKAAGAATVPTERARHIELARRYADRAWELLGEVGSRQIAE